MVVSVLEAGVPADGAGSHPGCVCGSDSSALPHTAVEETALCHVLLSGRIRHHPSLPLGLDQRRIWLWNRTGDIFALRHCEEGNSNISLLPARVVVLLILITSSVCRCFFLESWSCIWLPSQHSFSTSVKYQNDTFQVMFSILNCCILLKE